MTEEAKFIITIEYNNKITNPDTLATILQEILDAHEIQCDVSVVGEE